MNIEYIGSLAALTSTLSLCPQIIKTHQTHTTDDLSWGMLGLFLCTCVLWMIYGWQIHSPSVFWGNVIMTLCSLWLLALKTHFDTHPNHEE